MICGKFGKCGKCGKTKKKIEFSASIIKKDMSGDFARPRMKKRSTYRVSSNAQNIPSASQPARQMGISTTSEMELDSTIVASNSKSNESNESNTVNKSNKSESDDRRTIEQQRRDNQDEDKSNERRTGLLSPLPDTAIHSTQSNRIVAPLTELLLNSGNGKAWQALHSEFQRKKSRPVIVWGPTGVGKTTGVKACADLCGLRVYEIEPSILDSTENLKKWLTHICAQEDSVRTLLGPRMVLVDIIEGFDTAYVEVFEQFLKKNTSTKVPIVFIFDTIYNLPLKNIVSRIDKKIRCFKPYFDRCLYFAKRLNQKVPELHISNTDLQKHATNCNGNLRTLKCLIFNRDNTMFFSKKDATLSMFESIQEFLTGTLDFDMWIQCSEKKSMMHLITDNYCTLVTNMEKTATMSELISSGDCFRWEDLENYELMQAGIGLKILWNSQKEIPKMTLGSRPHVLNLHPPQNAEEYELRASRLYIPKILIPLTRLTEDAFAFSH